MRLKQGLARNGNSGKVCAEFWSWGKRRMVGISHQVSNLDDIRAFSAVPLADRLPADNTYGLIKQAADKFVHQQKALIFLPTGEVGETAVNIGLGEVFAKVTQMANYLHSIGIGHQEAVSSLLPTLPETVYTLWGSEAQAIASPINPLLDGEHIVGIINAAGSRVLVTLAPNPIADFWSQLEPHLQSLPNIETVMMIDMMKYYRADGEAAAALPDHIDINGRTIKIVDFDAALGAQTDDRLESGREIKGGDIASYFHTGGTTGTPKLAQHTHLNEAFTAWVTGKSVDYNAASDVMLCGAPLFHVMAALVQSLPCLASGTSLVIATPSGYRNPLVIKNCWKLVEKHRISLIVAVPTVHAAIIEQPVEACDISSIRLLTTGAAPIAADTFRRVRDFVGCTFIEGYGMTETTALATLTPIGGTVKVGSIGPPLAYVDARVAKLDADGNILAECENDEVGVLLMRGPNIFPGYLQTDKNDRVLLEGGWLNSGDLARIDGDGYVYIVGRAKDTIIRGGHNIDPAIIDSNMEKHADVILCTAIGQPDPRVGEIPVAYVTIREGSDISEEALLSFAAEVVPERAAVPKRIEIIEEMPVTTVGKIFKPELRLRAAKTAIEQALEAVGIDADVTAEKHPRHERLVTVALKNPTDKSTAETATRDYPLMKVDVV
jgi:fatty-acyl-CoA synthase